MSAQYSQETLLLRLEVEAFFADYMHAIDSDRLEEWHTFFMPEGTYKVTTRENVDLGLPLSLMNCHGHGMFQDRISALRTANIYEPHVYCHIPGAMRITQVVGDVVETESTFTIIRTMHEGEMKIFVCGRSYDRLQRSAQGLKLADRTVVLDSKRIDTLLVLPI